MSRPGLPLSDDIIDRILLFSPTFASLLATILTAKSFYNVFRTHPKSIVRAVAYNITGPALPQALSCIRHPDIARPYNKLHHEWGSEFPSEDENGKRSPTRAIGSPAQTTRSSAQAIGSSAQAIDMADLSEAPITAAETHKIVANAKVVARLEDLFSARYFDRSSSTSQLSQLESQIFRVAVYHLMLYSSIFHPSTWSNLLDSDDDDDDHDAAGLRRQQVLDKRTQFLSVISTPELFQIHSVGEFLKETFMWRIRFQGYPPSIRDLAPAVGPVLIVESFDDEEDSLETFEDILDLIEEDLDFHPMVTEYLSGPLVKILEARNEKPPQETFAHWHSISPRIFEKISQCDRCYTSYEFEFYHNGILTQIGFGERNDDPHYYLQTISQYLKGSLRYNKVESDCLRQEAQQYGSSSHLLVKIWDDLWNFNLVKQQSQSQLVDWTRDDFLCSSCFRMFLIENLWVWLWHTKAVSGTLKENCWYGYNCRTQTHKQVHAERLSHLCEQTRH